MQSLRIFKNRFFQLIILSVTMLSLRLFYLFTTFNVTYGEEGLTGILAKHIFENKLKQSIFDYFHPYDGGAVIESILASPFFHIFGVSIISLRLVPLFFSIGILSLIFILSDALFNRKVAVFAAFLYIFSPPSYMKYSFYCTGNHHSVLFFDMLMLFIFSKIYFDPDRHHQPKEPKYFIFLGLVSGFAMYFCFSSLTVLFLILLFWYIFDKLFFLKKQFFIFLISFIAGATPFIVYIFYHWDYILKDRWYNPFTYLRFSSLPCKFGMFIDKLANIKVLFSNGLIKSFNFDYFGQYPERYAWNYIYYFVVISSFGFLLWFNRKCLKKIFKGMIPLKRFDVNSSQITPESFLVIFPVIFLLACFFTGYVDKDLMQNRYYFTLYPFFYIYISLFLARLFIRNNITKIFSIIIGISIILMSIMGNLSLIGKRDVWTIFNLDKVVSFLKSKDINYIYTYYIYKFPFAFESKEQITPSSEEIYGYDSVTKTIVDNNKYGEPYQYNEKIVDEAVSKGSKFAYVFNEGYKFGHCAILEEYLQENRIKYKKAFIELDFLVYYDFSSIVKPKDINFPERWKLKNIQK